MSLSDTDLYQQLGAAQQSIEHLHEAQQATNRELTALRNEIYAISQTLATAKGGWQVLLTIGSAGAALGASLVTAVEFFRGT